MNLHITNLRRLCWWRPNGLCINKYVKWGLVACKKLTVPALPVCCRLWYTFLSWMNFAVVIWTSVCLFPGPSGPGVSYMMYPSNFHIMSYTYFQDISLWFYSPYAKCPLSLVTCEKSYFEVCYTERDQQRNTIVKATGEELKVANTESVGSVKEGKSSASFLLSACSSCE